MSVETSTRSKPPEAARDATDRRQVWLCADDYGISSAVDIAIRDLIVRGRINATSVMVTAPSFQRSEAMSLKILNAGSRRVAIGLHLVLTAPFRPLRQDFAPLQDGAFLSLTASLGQAMLRKFKPDALAAEIAGQLRAFEVAFGQAPDFVDGHQHVHLFPQIRDVVLDAVKAMAPDAWVRQCGRVTPLKDRFGDRKGMLLDLFSRSFRSRAQKLGVRTNPAFAGTYGFDDEADFAALFPRFLDHLPDGGVIMCHPGFVDAELARLDPLTALREREYAFFIDDSFPALLARHGIALA